MEAEKYSEKSRLPSPQAWQWLGSLGSLGCIIQPENINNLTLPFISCIIKENMDLVAWIITGF